MIIIIPFCRVAGLDNLIGALLMLNGTSGGNVSLKLNVVYYSMLLVFLFSTVGIRHYVHHIATILKRGNEKKGSHPWK